jgi:hypothetical protein
MKLIKTTYQTTEAAHETLFIVKGIFKKRVYMVSDLGLYELAEHTVKEAKNDQKA